MMEQEEAPLDWGGHRPVCECVVDVVARPDSPMVARVTRLDSSHLSRGALLTKHTGYILHVRLSHTPWPKTASEKRYLSFRQLFERNYDCSLTYLPLTPPMLHHSAIIITLMPHQCVCWWLWSRGKARTGGGIVYTDQPILSHGRKYRGETEPKLPMIACLSHFHQRISPTTSLMRNTCTERSLLQLYFKFESDSWKSINLSDYTRTKWYILPYIFTSIVPVHLDKLHKGLATGAGELSECEVNKLLPWKRHQIRLRGGGGQGPAKPAPQPQSAQVSRPRADQSSLQTFQKLFLHYWPKLLNDITEKFLVLCTRGSQKDSFVPWPCSCCHLWRSPWWRSCLHYCYYHYCCCCYCYYCCCCLSWWHLWRGTRTGWRSS